MVALLAARFVVGSTIRVRVPPAELTVVDASAAAASGARVTSGAAACAGARVANNAAAPAVTRASAAAANRARLIDTFRKGRSTPASTDVVGAVRNMHKACSVLGEDYSVVLVRQTAPGPISGSIASADFRRKRPGQPHDAHCAG